MARFSLLVLLALMMTLSVAPAASADVHPVSQAQCAPEGVESGAIRARDAIGDPGRPAAPIPVFASDGRTEGRGGDAPAQGQHC